MTTYRPGVTPGQGNISLAAHFAISPVVKMQYTNAMMVKTSTRLDLRGLKCPLPVLKARKAMRSLDVGELITLETTDPLAVIDIPAFCNESGHRLVETEEHEDHHCFTLEKGAGPGSHL